MTTLSQKILKAMSEINDQAANGALIRVRELRPAVKATKAAFDAAVVALADAGKVALHHHDFPRGLTARDREELVVDGTEYVVGIALR